MRFVVLKSIDGTWHWELRQEGGVVVAKSCYRYPDRAAAVASLTSIRNAAPRALVFDPIGNLT